MEAVLIGGVTAQAEVLWSCSNQVEVGEDEDDSEEDAAKEEEGTAADGGGTSGGPQA